MSILRDIDYDGQLSCERFMVAYFLASRNPLFIMSSAPGPMMSEFRPDVVLRMCDTDVSRLQFKSLTVVEQERRSNGLSHRFRSLFQMRK